MMRTGSTISFDNLAIEQLQIQDRVTPEVWETHYLGVDGSHTMYIDAVRMEYARSSVAKRESIGDLDIRTMFSRIRNPR